MKPNRLPTTMIWAIVIATAVPTLMWLLGWGVDYSQTNLQARAIGQENVTAYVVQQYLIGRALHTILEWTAVCIALMTGVLSFVHFRLKHDVTTPIIGTALFFSGMLDACNILAADGIIPGVENLNNFLPFTWAASRTFNVAILAAGTLPFLIRKRPPSHPEPRGETRILFVMAGLFGLLAYLIIQVLAIAFPVPDALYPELWVPRPWESIPLLFWIVLGSILLPKFYRKYPNIFSHSLMWCALPATLLHLVAGLGSRELFDANFFNAYLLKIIAYCTPLIGLLLDYKNAYRAEIELEKTASKLDAARQIAESLLPADHPEVPGIDAAGVSFASEAVGGDFYDYFELADGRFGFVVSDVSGHDLAASLLAAQTRAYLRAYAASHSDLADIMKRLNESLVEDTKHRRFVTMFVGAIDTSLAGFEYAAAGHQGFLIRANGKVEVLDSNGLPVGMTRQNEIGVTHTSRLHRGDTVLIVTDGITEAMSPSGEQYGIQRLLDLICVEHERDVHEIADLLYTDVTRFCANVRPVDDVTILLLRWLDEAP
ncbi:PP2C family protein-serine/threonine phosphatase [Rubinisphaera margarita]|uniref:PP2C family protein-serine/threonine phosphatase n=1 Tax=Rubinisphaera margarita TaxID=2909586 RepID=UPI001EE9435A|nr:SpoIIE family protein phosphatase [Rubinisphaera margarita]MCG6157086.1 serine/threonine-protein phosphatase [Rubinisphaera margarita]